MLALWIPASNDDARIAFATLYGFFTGAYVTLLPALVADISPFSELGTRTGIIFFASAITGVTSNPISGAILGDNDNWLGAKAFAGIFCLVGTAFVAATRISKSGWKLFVKV